MTSVSSSGPNRTLVYQEDIRGNDTKQRWIFGGYERVKLENNDIEHRFMVGGTVVTHTDYHESSLSTERVTHLHKDAQGSTIVITGNAVSGNVLKQQLAYDPWGKQSTLWSHSQFVLGKYLGEMRGYTGHTMVNDMDVIHMGGRTYNPVLGRFMQADPFIQAGTNLQNYNRYSYVLNNPLSYTDPSGYFFKKLSTTFGRFTPLLSIAIMVIPGAQPLGVTMLQGFFAGGIATGNLRGAIVGGLTAGMGKSLGGLKGVGGFMSRGIVGGAASSVQGGKFSHGFVSAGASSLGGNTGSPTGNILMSAMVGGTVSHLVGGKFANGAVSAGLASLFTVSKHEHARRKSTKNIDEDKDANNDDRTVTTITHKNHSGKMLTLNISNELTVLIEALTTDASEFADAILRELSVGKHRVRVDADYRIKDAGKYVIRERSISLNPNGLHGHGGVAQLVLGHELIHYRDHQAWGSSYRQRIDESQVNAYSWEMLHARQFISAPSYAEIWMEDAGKQCRSHGGCDQ
ncbi:RHS repeat-associated core domain-containing protein [Aliidiomarina quisquiliarum]|uniref:RHS repeat-associated core domain-containing protein n=1 Tax=Aliidiomarina quisquiliarum TaxID=2938947 RepID=UPI00208E6816|nr:RHS repeat-associated core domain-containing protein [Aliidiomarina quisquiliarum]MCO4321229.1 hypothetical protein [Aliidiomarina quisquiliarum]